MPWHSSQLCLQKCWNLTRQYYGKIAPFILNNPKVDSYTGIDSSPDMVKLARWHLEQFPEKPSEIIKEDLEKINSETHGIKKLNKDMGNRNDKYFDFTLFINSYYAWSSQEYP